MTTVDFLFSKPTLNMKVPKELPLLMLVASSIWYVQAKAKYHMMKK